MEYINALASSEWLLVSLCLSRLFMPPAVVAVGAYFGFEHIVVQILGTKLTLERRRDDNLTTL